MMQNEQEEIIECSICWETLNDDICDIKCGHRFHNKCLKMMNNDLCPLCRTKMGINREQSVFSIIAQEYGERRRNENQRFTDEHIQAIFARGEQRLQGILDRIEESNRLAQEELARSRLEEEERNRRISEELNRARNRDRCIIC